jgi:hypothetical protein
MIWPDGYLNRIAFSGEILLTRNEGSTNTIIQMTSVTTLRVSTSEKCISTGT